MFRLIRKVSTRLNSTYNRPWHMIRHWSLTDALDGSVKSYDRSTALTEEVEFVAYTREIVLTGFEV